ncbi:hypothetical protein INT43_006432 [Umbelopsis isabellina]|uniref:Uncharacterized protein n=1 Tax=Mortierella isabellina TaxID=91625 RepID=A0A8H7UF42_MORIS|nr:hypothetical protein INT43_006432 [Umbelopsis isabellina]
MDAQLPHIVIECTTSNRAALDVPEHDSRNHSCLSPFTNDLSMWSPNASCHGSSYLDVQSEDDKDEFDHEDSQSIRRQDPQHINTLKTAYQHLYGNNVKSENCYPAEEMPFPVKISSSIDSDYGYAHQHSDSVVSCILCGLEAYRRFQHKMGWPYHTEYPDFKSFTMNLSQPESPKCTKIYPSLTTEDEWLQIVSKWKGDDTKLERLSASIYSNNTSVLPLLNEKSSGASKANIWRRMGNCMSYCISRLRCNWK